VLVPPERLEIEQLKLKEVNSKVHNATNSAPEIDKLIEETIKTHFTTRINEVPIINIRKGSHVTIL
jgi:hypothetical protein